MTLYVAPALLTVFDRVRFRNVPESFRVAAAVNVRVGVTFIKEPEKSAVIPAAAPVILIALPVVSAFEVVLNRKPFPVVKPVPAEL